MKCHRCQTLNTPNDRRCVACGSPLRQAHVGAGKVGLFFIILLAGYGFASLHMKVFYPLRPGHVLTACERDERIGRWIGSICGGTSGIAIVLWLRSHR
jgi:hypothetical protein